MGKTGPLKLQLASALKPAPDVRKTVAGRVSPVAPDMPPSVAADAELAELWEELVPLLEADGLVSPVDGMTIELALRHYRAARRAAIELDRTDALSVPDGRGGEKRHPLAVEFRQESAAFRAYVTQLGLSFVARARTPAGEAEQDPDTNPFVG